MWFATFTQTSCFFLVFFSWVWSDGNLYFLKSSHHHITSPHFRFLSEVMEAVEVNDLDLVWQHLRDTGEVSGLPFNQPGEWTVWGFSWGIPARALAWGGEDRIWIDPKWLICEDYNSGFADQNGWSLWWGNRNFHYEMPSFVLVWVLEPSFLPWDEHRQNHHCSIGRCWKELLFEALYNIFQMGWNRHLVKTHG